METENRSDSHIVHLHWPNLNFILDFSFAVYSFSKVSINPDGIVLWLICFFIE